MSLFGIFRRRDVNGGVARFRETEGALLLDVRTRTEYGGGHIAGSTNLPLGEIAQITELAPDKATPLFVYCQGGARSARAAAYLRKHGYTAVHDLGGIAAYRGARVR